VTSIAKKEPTKSIRRLRMPPAAWRFSALLILIVVFSLRSPHFLTQANWVNTTQYSTDVLVIALGMTFVIVTGGIDLSVGGMMGIASSVAAEYLSSRPSSWGSVAVACLLAIGCTTAFGAINGLIITRMRIIPLIATLGTLGVASGLTNLIVDGAAVPVPPPFSHLGTAVLFGWLPAPTLVAVVLYLGFGYLLTQTRFGVHTYAIGSNNEAARRNGVSVRWHLFRIYLMSGFLSGIAGVLLVSRLSVGVPDAGQNVELSVIAAVVIGGASLFGGSGSLIGTLVGTAIVSMLVTGLVLIGVQPYWQTIVVGIVIILSVYIQDASRRRLDIE
jgi:ribose transport system permease protein